MIHRGGRLSRRRIRHVTAVWIVCFALLATRMAWVQVGSFQQYEDLGLKQRIRTERQLGPRGDLFDRRGVALAMSVPAYTVSINPRQVDPSMRATYMNALAAVLPLSRRELAAKLSGRTTYQMLARNLDDTAASRLRALRVKEKLDAVSIEDQIVRVNPAGDLARSVIGRVSLDGGVSGLEKQLDGRLRGNDGKSMAEYDRLGRRVPTGASKVMSEVQRGTSFVLSVDRSFQYTVESLLKTAVARYNALRATAIVMDTDGQILAMTTVDQTRQGPVVSTRADSVVATYDPGSVNKVITISGALEDGLIRPDERFGVPDTLQVADHLFSDDHRHATLAWTMGDILSTSSNVGTIMIAKRLGKDRVDSYLRKFGLGRRTGIEFPGESVGIMRSPNHWSGTDIGAIPIGQGIQVTPLQMLSVYAALAGDGRRVTPQLIKAVVSPDGVQTEQPAPPQPQVVSAGTAEQVRTWLRAAVVSGTGQQAAVPGYSVAGKTGTARKRNPVGSGYKPGAYIASFIGMIPAEHPRLVAMVLLDEPTPIYGGQTAAPVFSEIMRQAVQHFRVAPTHQIDRRPSLSAVARAPRLLEGLDGDGHTVSVPQHGDPALDPLVPTTLAATPSTTPPSTLPPIGEQRSASGGSP